MLGLTGATSSLIHGHDSRSIIVLGRPEVTRRAVVAQGFIAAKALFTVMHNTVLAENVIRNEPSLETILFFEELSAEDDCNNAHDYTGCSNYSQDGPFDPWFLRSNCGRFMELKVLTCGFKDVENDDFNDVES